MDVLASRFAQCPFTVKHLPVERSLFPVCSTMRASNTALRAAEGELIVHVCDGAVPGPSFLADHWRNYKEDPKSFGIQPYRGRTVKPEHWSLPMMGAWDMVERCVQGGNLFPEVAWTGFKGRGLMHRVPVNVDFFCEPLDPAQPPGGSPALGVEAGKYANEWWAHYKVDSIPREAYLAVNGWDEEYDGGYLYADIDMSLRLMKAGWKPRVTRGEVPIFDFHLVTKRTEDVMFRQWWMADRLAATQHRLEADPTNFRCVEGLNRPKRSHTNDTELLAPLIHGPWPRPFGAPLPPMRVTMVRPWIKSIDGSHRLDVLVPPEYALAWQWAEPPVLVVNGDGQDHGRFVMALGDQAAVHEDDTSTEGRWKTVVYVGDENGLEWFRNAYRDAERVIIIGNETTRKNAVEAATSLGLTPIFHDADDTMPVDAVLVFKD